jgi:integrase
MSLSSRDVRTLTARGVYSDGGNLYLQVRGPEQRSWVFRYTRNGKAHTMGLGVAKDVSLAEARNKADAARKLLRDGRDPLDVREAVRVAEIVAKARAVTFADAIEQYVSLREPGWSSQKHRTLWRAAMATYVGKEISALPVAAINTDVVLEILQPIWNTKPETASRLRGRIEAVLDYAMVRGWRERGHNPAVWRGHLKLILPASSKVRPSQHFAALDWREAPAFMAKLRQQNSVAARALQFAILTAARAGEVRGATWDEIDMQAAEWNIPGPRMKGKEPHRVPLSRPALDVLRSMELLRTKAGLVFPGEKLNRALTHMVLLRPLAHAGRDDVTAHGFRSTFRDWAAETTGHPNHVVEKALAHKIPSAVEAAYRRGDLFAKRVVLMNDWANYLARSAAKVVPLQPGKKVRA